MNMAIGVGLSIPDLDHLEYGMIMDMVIEKGNDNYKSNQLATQEDFDRF